MAKEFLTPISYSSATVSTVAHFSADKTLESKTYAQTTALLNAMVGDSGSGGTKGLVPAPAAGDAAAGKYLNASGAWETPSGGGSFDYGKAIGIMTMTQFGF